MWWHHTDKFKGFLCVCPCVCASTSNRGDTTAKTPSEHMEQRTTGTCCTSVGPGGGFGTSTNRWTSSGNSIQTCNSLLSQDTGMRICCYTRQEFIFYLIFLWLHFKRPQTLSSCALLLLQEVLRREDRSVLRLARLVHGDAVSCSAGRPLCVPVRPLHAGALPGQVNTPRLFYERK